MQRSALCRSRRELSNEYLLAKIGVDTAENEPLEVWGKIQFIIHSPPTHEVTADALVCHCTHLTLFGGFLEALVMTLDCSNLPHRVFLRSEVNNFE